MTSMMAAIDPLGSPAAEAAGASGSTASEGSTISANDFLVLLVTEMKNQDPTAQTDPNQYINQLVQVNSLEQLIQINESLSGALNTPSAHLSGGKLGSVFSAGGQPSAILTARKMHSLPQELQKHGLRAENTSAPPAGPGIPVVSGNLDIPKSVAGAERIAQALSGR